MAWPLDTLFLLELKPACWVLRDT